MVYVFWNNYEQLSECIPIIWSGSVSYSMYASGTTWITETEEENIKRISAEKRKLREKKLKRIYNGE